MVADGLLPAGAPAHVETALILPSGMIHLPGVVIGTGVSPAEALVLLWQRSQTAADHAGRLVVKAALPDGTVAHRVFDRGAPAAPAVPVLHCPQPDVRWDHGVPDRANLLGAVSAGRRAGHFAGSAVAAGRPAEMLRGDLGVHPYAVMAVELQAECAALAGEWTTAATCHLTAAVARHYLAAPGTGESAAVERAVAAWLRIQPGDATTRSGLTLAHHLLNLCPVPVSQVTAVLRALDRRLSPPAHDDARAWVGAQSYNLDLDYLCLDVASIPRAGKAVALGEDCTLNHATG
jgi:hypothetical protein